MCVVSNIGDMGRTMWPEPWRLDPHQKPYMPYNPGIYPPPTDVKQWTPVPGQTLAPPPYSGPTKEQFEEFLKLLRAAKRFDTLLGMKDCEMAEKLEWLKAIAAYLGADVKDLVT